MAVPYHCPFKFTWSSLIAHTAIFRFPCRPSVPLRVTTWFLYVASGFSFRFPMATPPNQAFSLSLSNHGHCFDRNHETRELLAWLCLQNAWLETSFQPLLCPHFCCAKSVVICEPKNWYRYYFMITDRLPTSKNIEKTLFSITCALKHETQKQGARQIMTSSISQ
jgi:hypothetical protein